MLSLLPRTLTAASLCSSPGGGHSSSSTTVSGRGTGRGSAALEQLRLLLTLWPALLSSSASRSALLASAVAPVLAAPSCKTVPQSRP